MSRINALDSGLEYKKQFKTEEYMQNVLRNRMIKCIEEKKITQRTISKKTGINEGALSNWKNKKPIGTSQIWNKVDNYNLDIFSIGCLHNFLNQQGY